MNKISHEFIKNPFSKKKLRHTERMIDIVLMDGRAYKFFI